MTEHKPWWEILDPCTPDPVIQTLYGPAQTPAALQNPEPSSGFEIEYCDDGVNHDDEEFDDEGPEYEYEDDEPGRDPDRRVIPSYGGYFTRIDEVQARPDARRKWLVEGILPLRYLAVLGGAPKAGKTTFATALAYAVAAGKDLAGRPVRQGPVLYWSLEENAAERAHLSALAPLAEDGGPIPFYYGFRAAALEDREFLEILQTWFLKVQPVLIVIDSLHAACRMGTLGDNHRARCALTLLKRLADWSGATVLLLHHTTKSASRGSAPDRFSDSAQIRAVASMHMHLDSAPLPPLKDAPARTQTILTLAGRGLGIRTEVTLESRALLDYIPHHPEPGDERATELLELLEENPLTAAQIAAALELTPTHARRLLNALIARGFVNVPEPGRRPRLFSISDPASSADGPDKEGPNSA